MFGASKIHVFNPRTNGTPDFPSRTGGGGLNTPPPPSISAPIGRREKRKNVRKLLKNDELFKNENYFSQFFAKSKLWRPVAIFCIQCEVLVESDGPLIIIPSGRHVFHGAVDGRLLGVCGGEGVTYRKQACKPTREWRA